MTIPLYQVDAFTGTLFGGNPAAVCLLDRMLPDRTMQQIASENNLSETAFVTKEDGRFHIRWFTPVSEVDLCGHATLGASHVLFTHQEGNGSRIEYRSRSGMLAASLIGEKIMLDFPADAISKSELPAGLADALGAQMPQEVYKGRTDYMLVYGSEADILAMEPDFHRLKQLPCRGIIVTAEGSDCDFVSRFFAPLEGINEDPVTGSAHTTLAPYWAGRLGKNRFTARQLSKRRGELAVQLRGDRVEIAGSAVTYMIGTITLPDSMT
ncbi:MAG: PhzF family phenazine biosynthesis protein [Acidobacteriota bacterium]